MVSCEFYDHDLNQYIHDQYKYVDHVHLDLHLDELKYEYQYKYVDHNDALTFAGCAIIEYMMILYNPKTGSPIPSFHLEGSVISGDKDPLVVLAVGELAQFEPAVGEFMKKNWGFLVEVTPEEAKKIVEKPKEAAFKCQYCEFSTEFKMALTGHLRTHSQEIAQSKKPAIDPSIIPVITAVKSDGSYQPAKSVDEDIAVNGGTKTDKDGVSWYGPGSTEEPRSQSTIGPIGTGGHFGGGL